MIFIGICIVWVLAILFYIAIKYSRDLARFIIYILILPLWIYAMFYYNELGTYIIFGVLTLANIIYIIAYAKHKWG